MKRSNLGFGNQASKRLNKKSLREIGGDEGGKQNDASQIEISLPTETKERRILSLLKEGKVIKVVSSAYQEFYVAKKQRQSKSLQKTSSKRVVRGFRQIRGGNLSTIGGAECENPSGLEKRGKEPQNIGTEGRETATSVGDPGVIPGYIDEKHWKELIEGSAIDPGIAALNFKSLSGDDAYRYLIYEVNAFTQRVHPDAQYRQVRKKYKYIEQGGWWCSGLDPLDDWRSMLWGVFKPNEPRIDPERNNRLNKYENPPKASTRAFFLRVTIAIWRKVARRYKLAMPKNIIITPEGEAIGFWQWVLENPAIAICITEGAKKVASLLSIGCVAIAVPGIHSCYRQLRDELKNKIGRPRLIEELRIFCQPDREFTFCFDQEARREVTRDVNRAIEKTAQMFLQAGCSVRVINWHPSLGKGIDDILVQFGKLREKVFWDELQPSAKYFDDWQTHLFKALTYPIGLELKDSPENRYLKKDITPPDWAQLICLKSPKGTGKTEWLAHYFKPLLDAGVKVLLLTHRVQLGTELCNRIGINYVTELRESETGNLMGYGLCVDSLHKNSQARFDPKYWEGAYIVIDEVEQVIWHLLNSSTCMGDRVSILRNLREVVQLSLETGGKVLIADADLTDLSIDYIRSLAGFDLKPWILVNNWSPDEGEDREAWSYPGNDPAALWTALEKHISEGGKPFVCLSGQRKKSKWGTQILEARLKQKFPEKRILRIDRESIADPQHEAYACMSHLNELLPNYDIVLASPTIETGVSITVNHFDSVWGIFQGVQTCDAARQALARVRANVPRHIWARKVSFNVVGNGSTSSRALLFSQNKIALAHTKLLTYSDFTDDINLEFQPQSCKTWGNFAARINLGMRNYRQTIINGLEEEGYIVYDAEEQPEDEVKATKGQIKKLKEEEYCDYCQAVAETSSPDDKRFKQLEDQRAKKEIERLEWEKGKLERRYKVEVNPELVRKDEDGWHAKAQLHYYLTVGNKYLGKRDGDRARKQLEAGDGAVFKPDFNKSQLGLKVAYLIEKVGFLSLLENRDFREDDPTLAKIAEFCLEFQKEIKDALGITIEVKKATPIKIAKKLLTIIGYQIVRCRREGGKGNQIWIYSAAAPNFARDEKGKPVIDPDTKKPSPIPDGREQVFAAWVERDEAEILAREQALAAAKTAQSAAAAALDQINGCQVGKSESLRVDRLINIDLYMSDLTTDDLTTDDLSTRSDSELESQNDLLTELDHLVDLEDVGDSEPATLERLVNGLQAATTKDEALAAAATLPGRLEDALWLVGLAQRYRLRQWLREVYPEAC